MWGAEKKKRTLPESNREPYVPGSTTQPLNQITARMFLLPAVVVCNINISNIDVFSSQRCLLFSQRLSVWNDFSQSGTSKRRPSPKMGFLSQHEAICQRRATSDVISSTKCCSSLQTAVLILTLAPSLSRVRVDDQHTDRCCEFLRGGPTNGDLQSSHMRGMKPSSSHLRRVLTIV